MGEYTTEKTERGRTGYWGYLEEHQQILIERLAKLTPAEWKERIGTSTFDPHHVSVENPYAFSDLHVVEDMAGTRGWLERENLRDALDCIMDHCMCVDDDPAEVEKFLSE